MRKKIRQLLSISLLTSSIVLILWSLLPTPRLEQVRSIQPGMLGVKPNGDKQPRLPGNRQVRLEWPGSLRIGDEGEIRLSFENLEAASLDSELGTGFYDIYERYSIMAEAKFEAAGVTIEPGNPTRVSMPPGQPAHFKWTVSPQQVGSYHGNVWLTLRYLPLDGSTPIQEPVYINEVELNVSSVMGLSRSMAQLLGGLGVIIGILLVYTEMISLATGRKNRAPLGSLHSLGR
jgi:hypothetical protein